MYGYSFWDEYVFIIWQFHINYSPEWAKLTVPALQRYLNSLYSVNESQIKIFSYHFSVVLVSVSGHMQSMQQQINLGC